MSERTAFPTLSSTLQHSWHHPPLKTSKQRLRKASSFIGEVGDVCRPRSKCTTTLLSEPSFESQAHSETARWEVLPSIFQSTQYWLTGCALFQAACVSKRTRSEVVQTSCTAVLDLRVSRCRAEQAHRVRTGLYKPFGSLPTR